MQNLIKKEIDIVCGGFDDSTLAEVSSLLFLLSARYRRRGNSNIVYDANSTDDSQNHPIATSFLEKAPDVNYYPDDMYDPDDIYE